MGKLYGHRRLRRALVLFLTLVLVFSALGGTGFAAGGKKTPTRAIAIVFDNSGSMYMNGNKAWCQATYAIEAFAAMMNEGDTLQVYPMNPMSVGQGGTEYTYDRPLTVHAGDDVSIIEKIYTEFPADTPIESIGAAYRGVQKVEADEKWVIILTDGGYFYEDGEMIGNTTATGPTEARLLEVLPEYNRDMNIMYLGIGRSVAMPVFASTSGYYYSAQQASDSSEVTNVLTDMGNTIFGRNKLENASGSLSFDVSMSKLIVFVQGRDISGVTLKDSSGNGIGSVSSCPIKYCEDGDGYYFASPDTSLSGVLVTYGGLDAGSYTLEYSGSVSSLGVYYEPDVDLVAQLVDENGNVVTSASELYAGDYTIRYGLVDRDGNFTDSALLGDVNYEITYILNGVEQTVSANRNDEITVSVAANDTLDCRMKATYLKDYTIEKDAGELGWPVGGFTISPRPVGELSIQISEKAEVIKLSEAEETPVCRVEVICEGEKLTGEKLGAVELFMPADGGNAGFAAKRDGDSFLLNVQYAGSAEETDCGEYSLVLSAAYVNEDAQRAESPQTQLSFTLEDDSYGVKVRLEAEQKYYVAKDLARGEPVVVRLTHSGEAFTDEELAGLSLKVDTGGLPYELEPVPGESAYRIVFKEGSGIKSGYYRIECSVTAVDPLGNESSDSDSVKIQVRPYPLWLAILVIVLILIVLFVLLHLYLNTKVLPKNIKVNDETSIFSVKGKNIPGACGCSFSGKGKKRGSITISSPSVPSKPLVEHNITLTVVAVSPRKTKSSRRLARVIKVSAPDMSVKTVSVDGMTLTRNAAGALVDAASPDDPLAIDIGSGSNIMSSGKTVDKTSFTLSAELEYK